MSGPAQDPFHLGRFLEAQQATYAGALAELRAGRKRSHWIWYILPQLEGLGRSPMAQRYGLSGRAEARAYLAHPVLGPRLLACVEAVVSHPELPVAEILGEVDALKYRSCLTLFASVDPTDPIFERALRLGFGGQPDPLTLRRLASAPED